MMASHRIRRLRNEQTDGVCVCDECCVRDRDVRVWILSILQTEGASNGGPLATHPAFRAIGEMRGVGWVILFQDPGTHRLTNHWVTLHHEGVPAGFTPLLVMDVWEHAFMRDYKATERGKYIGAFFRNIDWRMIERRLQEPIADGIVARGLTITTTELVT
jgi:Iron/manganese superoxide dismutases, C-terminal domain